MSLMASQITSLTIVYSTVYSGVNQRKHQSSASLAFMRGIHRGPVNSPHKWPVTRKMFPFDDVIMIITNRTCFGLLMSSLRSLDVRLKLPCSYLWQLVWIKTQPGQNGFIWSEKKIIHYIYMHMYHSHSQAWTAVGVYMYMYTYMYIYKHIHIRLMTPILCLNCVYRTNQMYMETKGRFLSSNARAHVIVYHSNCISLK